VSWGFYFYGYNALRDMASQTVQPPAAGEPGLSHLSPAVNLACASSAGVLTAFVTQPIWLAKTRLQLQYGSDVRYSGMLHVLASVTHHEGVLGLWRGLLPSLMLVSHVSIHFTVYEEIKKILLPFGEGGRLQVWQTFAAGSCAKIIASVMTYPFQVVRARMQQLDPEFFARRRAETGAGISSSSAHVSTSVHEKAAESTAARHPLRAGDSAHAGPLPCSNVSKTTKSSVCCVES
jgi:solute carrier family 25 folate transporter 32